MYICRGWAGDARQEGRPYMKITFRKISKLLRTWQIKGNGGSEGGSREERVPREQHVTVLAIGKNVHIHHVTGVHRFRVCGQEEG